MSAMMTLSKHLAYFKGYVLFSPYAITVINLANTTLFSGMGEGFSTDKSGEQMENYTILARKVLGERRIRELQTDA
jgi:hypothetical protein